MKNFPFIIAIAGGAAIFFLWRQRQAQAGITTAPAPLARSSVPQEWIEMTPEGYGVIGTSGDPWDILT